MIARVSIEPAGLKFEANQGESLLNAALRAGLNIDYGCSNGSCGHCKVRLVAGKTVQTRHHDFILRAAERQAGALLMCCHSAATENISLQAELASSSADIPLQQLTAGVRKLDRCDDNTLLLHVRTPRSQSLRFMAGQHARLRLANGDERELPIASCPCDGMRLEFHIHRLASDRFTKYVFNELQNAARIDIEGPCGDFTLVENDSDAILFIAWGTGFAPIHSLIEHCLSLELTQDISLYWVVHEDEVHYADGYCRAVADAIDNFSYRAIRTDTAAEALAEIASAAGTLENSRLYIAAPPAIIDNTIDCLQGTGLDASKVKSDPLVA